MPLLVRLYLGFGWKASAVPRQTNWQNKEAKVKMQRSFASRSSSSSRPGLEQTASQVGGSTSAGGQDDDAASVLSRSSSGGEQVRGNTQFPCSRRSHGTSGSKSPARHRAHHSTPTRSQAGDLVGKYGVQASATDLEAPPLGSNPPPGDSTLGSSVPHSPPRSESKPRWKDPLLATPVITPG